MLHMLSLEGQCVLMLTRPHNIFDGHPYTAAQIVAAPTEFRSEHGSSSWGFCTFRTAKRDAG